MRTILMSLLLAPGLAMAAEHCTHSAPRSLQLDLAGVKSVQFDTGQHKVRLEGRSGGAHALTGRACAAKAGWLDQLTLTQEKRGDTLIVRARRDGPVIGLSLGNNHAYLDLGGSVPDTLPVTVSMGSGDVWVRDVASLDATVGSGDLDARDIRGTARIRLGSGDVVLDGAARLDIASIGSGDLTASDIGGRVDLASIGSGDFALSGVRGDVEIGTIGSGDVAVSGVTGQVTVGSLGSGELDVRDVGGRLSVRSAGSGDIEHRDVRGGTDLPRKR